MINSLKTRDFVILNHKLNYFSDYDLIYYLTWLGSIIKTWNIFFDVDFNVDFNSMLEYFSKNFKEIEKDALHTYYWRSY